MRYQRDWKTLAVIPALLGLSGALGSSVISLYQDASRIREILNDPLGFAIILVYSTVILAIVTVVVYQLTLSARTADSEEPSTEQPREPRSEAEVEEVPMTTAEVAARDRERLLSGIRSAFSRNRRRMISETERIQRNGVLNLSVGILFSAIALGVLGYPLVGSNVPVSTEWISMFEHFAPRFSVGILIQVIGFFFLRLYVSGEHEIHYIRNEITNYESRLIAYNAAAMAKDASSMKDVIKQLVRTERNFKIGRGEKSLYATDDTYNDMGQLLKDVASAVGSKIKRKHE